jgi:hypothetical protein
LDKKNKKEESWKKKTKGMMEPIFHDGKKSCVSDQNLEIEQNDL